MRRSKLEISLDILSVLALKGQLKLTHLILKSKVNCQPLKKQLGFLVNNGFVEKKIVNGEEVVYAITSRGLAVLRAFRSMKQTFILTEESSPNQYSQMYFSSTD